MNYAAPTNRLSQTRTKLTTWQKVMEIKKFLGHMWGLFVDLPRMILDKFGISLDFWSISPALCSMCICSSFITMAISIGIGLGIGLGVGLNCAQSESAVAIATDVTSLVAAAKAAADLTAAKAAIYYATTTESPSPLATPFL
ncbi:unnamed protein product [Rotaria sp. Silwood2]|nr:unnamed protein product [Rotaria sp. Silwood2]CAF2973990.1 unnamed protein product [Rotaria sp. Silwood2]CAF4018781.1 unnamed protein product [Rotaria sp. Silwood2]CAF4095781.1 unnamed protein product [Rotaria sp. Silwood2]